MALCGRAHRSAWLGVMQSASSDFEDTIKMLVLHVTPALMHLVRFFLLSGADDANRYTRRFKASLVLLFADRPSFPGGPLLPLPGSKKEGGWRARTNTLHLALIRFRALISSAGPSDENNGQVQKVELLLNLWCKSSFMR